jgi:hypothetical protein
MNTTKIHPAAMSPELRRTTSDSVYQIAIIVAAVLLVISASLF